MTNSAARAEPARSAMRWVPPAPGVKPTTASTSPNFADSAAQIMSQPSEISSPAVRHSPCTRASVGIVSSSRRRTTGISEPNASDAAPSSTTRLNELTSTPPVKMSPSARQTSALASEPSTSSMQETSAPQASSPNRFRGGFERTITATFPSRSSRIGGPFVIRRVAPRLRLRSTLAQSGGDLRDLVGVALLRNPGKLERIVLVARHHVDVEVEDRLPGRGAAGVDQVDPVRLERLLHPACQPLRGEDARAQVLGLDLEQVGRVPPRHHQGVPRRSRGDVHERDRAVVGANRLARDRALDDPAEQAVVRHPGAGYLQTRTARRMTGRSTHLDPRYGIRVIGGLSAVRARQSKRRPRFVFFPFFLLPTFL